MKNQKMIKMHLAGLMICGAAAMVSAQPGPVPPGTNTPCDARAKTDSLPFIPDEEGFSSLFDGATMKGWWESCLSGHSSEKVYGGTWLVDAGLKAIYSAQRSDGSGGLLVTNQKFGNYELLLDVWPDFGNDGGVFNRSTAEGGAFQTTLDYIGGSSLGGSYSEGVKDASGGSWNTDPYKFGANESSVTVQADNSWTVLTKDKSPTSFGCSANGCTAADWTKVWDINGWNQMRIKFYGGLPGGSSQIHMEVFIRDLKTPNKPWVPLLNQVKTMNLPANYIALQIHKGTSRWGGAAGSWYRNIRWQPLTDAGARTTVSVAKAAMAPSSYSLAATPSAIVGGSETDYAITLRDLAGKMVASFSGKAGRFEHALPTEAQGLLLVEIKNGSGAFHQRVSRLP